MPTESETKKPKRARLKHEYVDAQGNVLAGDAGDDDAGIEKAFGIRTTQLSNGHVITAIPQNPNAQRMLMVFGLKTLVTNEASQVRQKSGDNADAIPDIQERLALIEQGEQFADRTREGVNWNLDAMAEALVLALIDGQQLDGNDATAVGATKAKIRGMIEDRKVLNQMRGVEGAMDHYNKLVGKVAKKAPTAAELLAMVK